MKFRINQQVLNTAINKVYRAISSKNPKPALSGIKITINADNIELIASDDDISIKTCVSNNNHKDKVLDIDETGILVISAKFLTEIIKKIDEDFVELETLDNAILKIRTKNSEFSLNLIPVTDYPHINFDPEGQKILIDTFEFRNIVNQTSFAASSTDERPIFSGVNIKTNGNFLEFIATDSHRLARRINNLNESNLSFNVTLSAKNLNDVTRIVNAGKMIAIYFNEQKTIFVYEETTIIIRLINGVYMDTSRFIPNEFKQSLLVDSKEILSALDRASLFNIDDNNYVNLKATKNGVEISSRNNQVGSSFECLSSAKYEGDPLNISFSTSFAQDAIKVLATEEVELVFNGGAKPFVIKNPQDEKILQLIVPVKTF